MASYKGNADIVSLLQQSGADVNMKNNVSYEWNKNIYYDNKTYQ